MNAPGRARAAGRIALTIALCAFAAFAAWRIGTDFVASRLAAGDPARALELRPHEPAAWWSTLHNRGAHRPDMARRARELLKSEPLASWAFADVASRSPTPRSETLFRIATRRAPRLVASRVWLVNLDLRNRRYDDAMRHIDVLLRLTPPYRATLYPMLVQLSDDPAFTDALVRELRSAPLWRPEFVGTLLSGDREPSRHALLARLAGTGSLAPSEFNQWVDAMLAGQRWNEAFGIWASSVSPFPARLVSVQNGDFAQSPSNRGFDWRLLETPGVQLEFSAEPGQRGLAAHAYFSGRPAAGAGLEHPLLLAPGHYRLSARMRASRLSGEAGLQWTVTCGDRSHQIGSAPRISGSFEWRTVATEFDVPVDGCAGQWLQLTNPAPPGPPLALTGEIWFDDVEIRELGRAARVPTATLHAAPRSALRSDERGFVDAGAVTRLAEGDRLVVMRDAAVSIRFDDGCTQSFAQRRLYVVDRAGCQATPTGRSRMESAERPAPRVPVLPEAEAWKSTPIGR